ncbi:MAG: 5'-methylthioadenosine/adenosylhomocysteine nucleosidase [Erysipelothrix sp.]|nr:5'-methylthioadenosine/adenosylhomocysteine nucleosidase [Erysipelothrix sp.]
MIGIIGAMDQEVNEFLKLMLDVKEESHNGQTFYLGKLEDQAVVLSKSGVGKSLAAMSATLMVSNYNPALIINIGSAGALHKEFNVFDVIVAQRVAVADFDLTAFGYEKGFNQKRYSFECNLNLVDKLEALKIDNVYVGDMVSSDTFINSESLVNNILANYPTALCADMEAGSIAMVLDHLQIPFIVIRSISDNVLASTDNKVDFEEYLVEASYNSARVCQELIKSL